MTRHTDDELCAALRYEASIKRMDPEMVHVADAFEEAAEAEANAHLIIELLPKYGYSGSPGLR